MKASSSQNHRAYGACLHTSPTAEAPHGAILQRSQYDAEHFRNMQKEAKAKSLMASEKVGYPDKDIRSVS